MVWQELNPGFGFLEIVVQIDGRSVWPGFEHHRKEFTGGSIA